MRKSWIGLFALLGLASGLAAGGCGSSGASGGTYASAIDSCSSYCEAYFAKTCDPSYTASGFCKIDKCSPIPQTASVGCYTATKSWYDCLKAQSDVCATGCTDQAAAAVTACP